MLCEALTDTARETWPHAGRSPSRGSQTLGDEPYTALAGGTPLVWTVDLDRNQIFYDRDEIHLVHDFIMPHRGPLRLRDFVPYLPKELPMQFSRFALGLLPLGMSYQIDSISSSIAWRRITSGIG